MADQPLSPAAQAVLDASRRGGLAAAIRALADQAAPDPIGPLHRDRDAEQWRIRCKILAIAAQLERADA
jgi:hypothetical protein